MATLREIRGYRRATYRRANVETMHPATARRRGVEAIKRGLSETVVYAAEADYNQTVVHTKPQGNDITVI